MKPEKNVGWLIDGDMFPHYRDDLIDAIESQGHMAKVIRTPSPPFRWDDVGCSYRDTFPMNHCVVAHGDIELVTRIHNEQRWIPGAFATLNNYFCSNYINHFGKYWLNRDHAMLPFEELKQQEQYLFDSFGIDGRIFVRPDSPLKLFTGQTSAAKSFDADLEYMGFYEFPRDSVVIVSTPKTIAREWRFVACDQNVVAGCTYSENGKFELNTNVADEANQLALEIASNDYSPDPVWIVDICETADGQYHLLEIGGFSFADLYACNKAEIVAAVSAAAFDQWLIAADKTY